MKDAETVSFFRILDFKELHLGDSTVFWIGCLWQQPVHKHGSVGIGSRCAIHVVLSSEQPTIPPSAGHTLVITRDALASAEMQTAGEMAWNVISKTKKIMRVQF